MGTPVVIVASGGLPVIVSTSGYGVPMTVATNGYGIAVTQATTGLPVVGITFGPAAPATPVLDLTSGTSDTTPDFTLTGDLVLGDTVRFQYSTSAVFSGASELTNAIDAGEDAANTISFSTGALAIGTWYFRARIERSGVPNSDWSNTETITLVSTAATTWSTTDKTAALVLSGSNRTVTYPSGGNINAGIRSAASIVTGQKVYIEHVVNAATTFHGFGFANPTASFASGGAVADTVPTHGFGITMFNGSFHDAASIHHLDGMTPSFTVGDRIGLAYDDTAKLFWARKNGGAWNPAQGGTQDPATAQGGKTVSVAAGALFAWIAMDAIAGDQFTTAFASTDWVNAAPSGFTQIAA